MSLPIVGLYLDTIPVFIKALGLHAKLIIFKTFGKSDLTNWHNINFFHKNLAGPDSKILLKSINKYHKTGFKIHTTGTDYQTYIDKSLKRLSKHQYSWRPLLRKAKIHTLFDLLYRCSTVITDPAALGRTTYRIQSFIKKKCGLNRIPTFTISYPYDHRVNKAELTATLHKIIDSTKLTDNIKTHIKLQLRLVNTSRKSIARMLANTNRACERFNPEIEPDCIHHRL